MCQNLSVLSQFEFFLLHFEYILKIGMKVLRKDFFTFQENINEKNSTYPSISAESENIMI